jgi:REP element-mobilizing transposase RayT
MRDTRQARQIPLSFSARGGARIGAGRPRKKNGRVSHLARPKFARSCAVHATLRMRPTVFNLRSGRCFRALEQAFLPARDRLGLRLIHFAVLGNHVHLIVEAKDSTALSRGMQGLTIRLAKALNRVMGARGAVLADHYHARLLPTPTEVTNAIRYVLGNYSHHFPELRLPAGWRDPFSSACRADLVAEPRTWLLAVGWKRARPRAAPG